MIASNDGGTNRSVNRLLRGEVVFGILQTFPGSTLTEMAVWSGFEFVILDCEHGVVDEAAHLTSLQVLSNSAAFSVVRVKPHDLIAVGRYLDFGADSILMPDIRSAADAATFVAAAHHGPEGTRSSAGRMARELRYGCDVARETRRPLLFAMIESGEAVTNVQAIVATPGLAGIVIGPFDLAADLGTELGSAQYREAVETIERATLEAGLLLGSAPNPAYPIARLRDAGHRFILVSADAAAIREGMQLHLAAARGAS
jgi:4-hydroxy-2-oxoheptanedioate aldolase